MLFMHLKLVKVITRQIIRRTRAHNCSLFVAAGEQAVQTAIKHKFLSALNEIHYAWIWPVLIELLENFKIVDRKFPGKLLKLVSSFLKAKNLIEEPEIMNLWVESPKIFSIYNKCFHWAEIRVQALGIAFISLCLWKIHQLMGDERAQKVISRTIFHYMTLTVSPQYIGECYELYHVNKAAIMIELFITKLGFDAEWEGDPAFAETKAFFEKFYSISRFTPVDSQMWQLPWGNDPRVADCLCYDPREYGELVQPFRKGNESRYYLLCADGVCNGCDLTGPCFSEDNQKDTFFLCALCIDAGKEFPAPPAPEPVTQPPQPAPTPKPTPALNESIQMGLSWEPDQCIELPGVATWCCGPECKANERPAPYGVGPFTSDSSPCRAATFLGLPPRKWRGLTIVRADVYASDTRNGITTQSWGSNHAGYNIIDSDVLLAPTECRWCDALGYCKGHPEALRGRLWGSNPYTDDSFKCLAAKHAGMKGWIKVVRLGELPSFSGTDQNGVVSQSYGPYGGIQLVSLEQVEEPK